MRAMSNQSVWTKEKLPQFATVRTANEFEVVVIGGGIAGLTAGYLLKQAGKKVAVVERDRIGYGDTGNTTAHLTYVTDVRLKELVRTFGKEGAKAAWLAGAAAINTIERIVKQQEIDCNFSRAPGYLHASLSEDTDERDEFRKEAQLAAELGFDAAYLESVPSINKPGIRFSNQAKFHPLKYLGALAEAIHDNGCAVYENSEVSEVEDEPRAVVVGGKQLKCDYVVVATHVPLMGVANMASATLLQTKLYPYSSYVVGAKLPKGTLPQALYWDTTDPYYYLRVDRQDEYDYLIFGGADHKTGQQTDTAACLSRVEAKLHTLFPEAEVVDRWSGQVVETNDGLPFIGENAERQFIATGFSGNGMTFGTLSGMMACDAVLGRQNAWQELLAVDRKKIRGGTWDFLKENIDYPYYLVRDRVFGAETEAKSPDDLKPGDGKVLNVDGQRAAVSCDEAGKLHCVSAICTHMGCVVHWNRSEQTWDCPCHGSRFHADGEVLAGPAETPLEAIQPKTSKESKTAEFQTP
jgi:glycine/D-amino acid oxidase-like deaminating enzyme/nitrite reductase/ring-hydroxylating ferredoxin subunit